MTKHFKSILTLFMAFVMCFNIVITPVLATDYGNDTYEVDIEHTATNIAPDGYVPQNLFIDSGISMFSVRSSETERETPRVLLVEDVLPWDSTANQTVLSQITEYDKVTTSEFLQVDLTKYGVIVFANDQPFTTYENYKAFKEYMEAFAKIGGVIVFGACDAGWSNGNLVEKLPGDISKKTHYVINNYIVDDTHPIVTGSLYDNKTLLDGDLIGSYCSHVSFDEDTLPPGSKIILRESDTNRPTLVEYPLEKGRVIASGLTWEFTYVKAGQQGTYAKIGDFAIKAMDDMFRYAIRVSSIDVNAVHVLEEFYVKQNAHNVYVADKESKTINGANVTIDGDKYQTDNNGEVIYSGDYGIKYVTVTADGYRKSTQYYDLQPQQFKWFFLEKDTGDGKPYVTMVVEPSTFYDLRYQTKRYEQDSDILIELMVDAEWAGENAGKYIIYQEGSNKSVSSNNGSFKFYPGKMFEPDKQVKLKVVSEDGTESQPINLNIVIFKKLVISDAFVNNTSFADLKIADNQVGSVNDADADAIFPTNFQLNIPALPFEISADTDDDTGIVTWRGTIGIYGLVEDDNKKDEMKSEWLSLKNAVKKWEDQADKSLDAFTGLTERFAYKKWKGTALIEKKLFSPEINALGYIEIKTDTNGNVIESDGGVIVVGGLSSKYTRQFVYGPIPLYIDLGGSINIELQLGLGYDFVEDGWLFDGELSLKPSIYLGGGLGVSGLATVGVEGAGDLDIEVLPNPTGEITLKANLRAELLWVFDWRYTFARKTFTLWGGKEKAALMMMNYKDGTDNTISIASRDYNTKTSEWYGYPISMWALQDNPESIHTLQEYIMPNTIPDLVEIDGNYILIFQTDKADRTTGNNVVMMYSIYDNDTNVWSEPAPVCEGASSDLFAETFVIEDELYVVWQKIRKEMTSSNATDLLDEMTENVDISFAKWNKSTKSFEQAYVNSDDKLDMYPYLVVDDDKMSIVWVANSANNATGMEGTYSFYVSECENSTWSVPVKVYETETSLSEIAAGYVNDKLEILYAINTEDSGNIYRINGNTEELVPSQTTVGTNLIFNDGYFYWASAGKVSQYDASNNTVSEIQSGEVEAIMSSYRIVNNDSDTAVVWLGSNEEGNSVVYASVKTADGWSNPIELLSNSELAIQYLDVEFADDGTWHIICTVKDEFEENKVSLVYAHMDVREDTTLNYVALDETERKNGMQPVSFSVTNNGQNTLQNVNISIEDADGNTYYSKTENCNISSGATAVIDVEFDLSGLTEYTELEFTVSSANEIDLTDNVKTEAVGCVDVSLTVTQYTINNKIILAVEVINNSDISANAAISIIEDSTNGIVLDMKNIGVLSNDTSYVYLYSIDKTAIDFAGADHKYYYIVVNTLEEDLNQYDNTEIIAVYPEIYPDINEDGILNSEDVKRFAEYFAGYAVTINEVAADLDGDKKITRRDAMILARHLAGWEGYTLPYTVSSLDVLNEIGYIRCCFSSFGGSPNGYNDNGEFVDWNFQIHFSHEILHTYIDDLRNIEVSTSWTDQLVSGSSWDKAKSGITQITRTQSIAYDGTQLWDINILLPDDPTIAGEQFVLLSLDDRVLKISFNLTYNGDYKTETGWSISDVRY